MIGRVLFLLTILSNCALAAPVDSNQLENEDLKVTKCIVEALTDVLSRPHPLPISQECLVILKTDNRLVTILRRHNFLKELQDIAVQGDQERTELRDDAAAPDHVTQTPQTTSDASDRSMLEALGGLGERSVLSQKRRAGKGEEEKEERRGGGAAQEKREDEENPWRHESGAAAEWREDTNEKRKTKEHEEKRENSEGNSEEEQVMKDGKGVGFEEKRGPQGRRPDPKSAEEDEEEKDDKRSPFLPHVKQASEEEEEEVGSEEAGSQESTWTKRAKGPTAQKKAIGKEAQRKRSHSKEVPEEEEEEKRKRGAQRSQEVKELQVMIPEAKLGSEENGSGSQKDAETLAAIESELETVAHKLHILQQSG
ncbi:chromogranin-A [Thalassophryne amazonica]|uniref:chromogranin-A n=1 Tax=Thalassophryne amazonica TaxID=390379 RepID=UPI001471DACC|nr:chromogranin-A [Thalassophryne amazonica]